MTQKAIKIKITVGGGVQAKNDDAYTDNPLVDTVVRPNYQGIAVIISLAAILLMVVWFFLPQDDSATIVSSSEAVAEQSSVVERVATSMVEEPKLDSVVAQGEVAIPALAAQVASDTPVLKTEISVSEKDAEVAKAAAQQAIPVEKHIESAVVAVEPTAATPIQQVNSGRVARAQFTYGIEKREPIDNVQELSLADIKGDSVNLYFFSELRGMKGQTVTHSWLHGESEVIKIKFRVGGNRWRVYSSKSIRSNQQGTWSVVVKDAQGNELHRASVRAK